MAGRRTDFARPRGAAGLAILGSSAAALLLGWLLGYVFPDVLHARTLGVLSLAGAGLLGALLGVLGVLAYQRSVGRELAASRAALEESEARLDIATAVGGVGVWEWDIATDRMFYSPEAREIFGFSADEPVTLDDARAVTHPMDYPITWAQAQRALDPAVRGREQYDYRVVRRSDGAVRWVVAQGQAEFDGPGPGAQAVKYIGTVLDVTDRKAGEQALLESERRLRLALAAGRLAVWQIDLDGRGVSNPALNALFGFAEDARPTLEDFNAAYLPGEREKVQAAFSRSFEQGGARFAEVEAQIRRADGEVRWLNLRAELLEGAAGVPYRLIGVAADVTERKAAEERMLLLAREVDHRANNLLSVVQSTVALSRAPTPGELRTVIEGRVHALAAAHRLLTASRWEGADLETLIRDELLAFSLGRADQVQVHGPVVKLAPSAAQALGMVLHELTTNACKYGSLCKPDGRVEVTWAPAGDALVIDWRESGGPAVTPPSGRGFGSSVIERALGGPLGGEAGIEWLPEGVRCRMTLPLSRLVSLDESGLDPHTVKAG